MRILVLGGTSFVGRAVVEELAGAGHDVTVAHRGRTEPAGWIEVAHLHLERAELPARAADLAASRPDAAVDTCAMARADAEAAVAALPDVPVVVLSSMDVYLAYGELLAGRGGQEVPIDEDAPLRSERYPYRGRGGDLDDYDKLDVEDLYASRRATVCRLPVVFGPHDPQRREEFILRRVRAGRSRIPFGAGSWLWTRLHVADVAVAVRAALENPAAHGQVLNVAPPRTSTVRQWAETILGAAASPATLVRVPDDKLPADLKLSGEQRQHLLFSSNRIAELLGWHPPDQAQRVRESVVWHLADRPAHSGEPALRDDDRALAGT